jgi:hypothetical protein
MTPVIFRVNKSGPYKGDVTAVFPTLYAAGGLMSCYAHVGQHSGCSLAWYRTTRLATAEECVDLLTELVQIGYDDLKIYKRRVT